MLNKNQRRGTMLRNLSLVLAGTTVMSSVVLAPNAHAETERDCYSGFLCLFQNDNFNNNTPNALIRRFNLPGWIDLTQYNFNDQMTSWKNNSNMDAAWFNDTTFPGAWWNPAHCMYANTKLSNVGPGDNDKASLVVLGSEARNYCP